MDTLLSFFVSLNQFIDIVSQNAVNLTGFLMPLVVEYLNKDVVTKRDRFLVTFLSCTGAALLLNWATLFWGDATSFFVSLTIIFTQSQVVYKMYFEDSALRDKIQLMVGNKEKEFEQEEALLTEKEVK